MEYAAALEELGRAARFGIHPSLDGIAALTEELGRPQDAMACVQVTGTNGKSSVTRMTGALLTAEGMRCGVYTSPHLESYTERMALEGVPCSRGAFAAALRTVLEAAERVAPRVGALTEFELLTAAALVLFRDAGCDVACLEVGMGGRWDATSVVAPAVSVITGVSLDHTDRLGSTVAEIAADKAHVIKAGSAPVLGPGTRDTLAVFLDRAARCAVHPRFVAIGDGPGAPGIPDELTARVRVRARPDRPGGRLELDVAGVHGVYRGIAVTAPSYQAPNVGVAIAAAECALGRALDPAAATAALAVMAFPGRFELVCSSPDIVIDGAHNPEAARVLADAVREAWPDPERRPVVVLGVLADKDAAGIVAALAPVARAFVVTAPDSARALEPPALADLVERTSGVRPPAFDSLDAALVAATLEAPHGVVVTGSLYTVGQARAAVLAAGGATA